MNKFNPEYLNLADELLRQYALTVEDELSNVLTKDDLENFQSQYAGVKPLIKPIRGGTDGARLSFMGLPCLNIFTGGYNFHDPYEFAVLEDMEKAVEVIVNIARRAVEG